MIEGKDLLAGMRVVVTRGGSDDPLSRRLSELGATVISAPTIEIADPESWAGLDHALRRLHRREYEWVVFASVNAVRKVTARARGPEPFADVRIAAVGPSTAAALREHGLTADVVPARFTGVELARELGTGRSRVLLPRVASGPRAIVDALTDLGWQVDEVDAYRTVSTRPEARVIQQLTGGEFDVVTFTSPSTVRNFAGIALPASMGLGPESSAGRMVACIGPSTATAARSSGLRVDVVATRHTVEGLVDAVRSLKGATIDL